MPCMGWAAHTHPHISAHRPTDGGAGTQLRGAGMNPPGSTRLVLGEGPLTGLPHQRGTRAQVLHFRGVSQGLETLGKAGEKQLYQDPAKKCSPKLSSALIRWMQSPPLII